MGKRLIVFMLVVCFALLTTDLYAEHGMMQGKMKGSHGDFSDKVCKKAMMILKNQEELGLSDEQVKKIKGLKVSTRKDLIRKKADIDIVALDIKSALWEDEVDLATVNALIDRKYDLKKEKAKSLVAAYAALKGILTEEQRDKLKTLYRGGKDKKTKNKRR